MAGRVHHLTASATGGAASEPNLLDLCRQLWVPQDFAGVEAAIGELISNLFPGIRARLTRAGGATPDERSLRLPLAHEHQLELCPAPALAGGDHLLQAAVRLIELRLGALSRHQELTASVLRLEEAERLQRAL